MTMADIDELVDSTGSSFLDTVLHYGLFLGAIFQLVCIFAVIFVPQSEEEKVINHVLLTCQMSDN